MFSFLCVLVVEISDILAERVGKHPQTLKVHERLLTDNNEGNRCKAITAYIVTLSL